MAPFRIPQILPALVVFSAGAFGIGMVAADEYYVDSRTGDDAAAGTAPEAAWRTLERVNGVDFKPGDRLRLHRGGVWKGMLKPRGSGAPDAPVVVESWPLEGPGPLPRIEAGGEHPAALHLYNVQHWSVRRLELTNHGPERQPRRRGVWVQIEDCGTVRGITLEELVIRDVNGSLVKKQGGGGGIMIQNGGRIEKSRFDGVRVENCVIRNCTRNGINMRGYSNRRGWHPNLNVVIRGNLIEGVPGDGIVPTGCERALVEHNWMRKCPRLLPDGEAAAGIWPWSCDHTVIQFNEVSDHKAPWDAQGFDSDWNCRGTVIQYNFSHDNEGGFLLVCSNSGVGGKSNIGCRDTIVRYNLSVNDGLRATGRHAGFSPTFHISGNVTGTRIYHNTIVVPAKPGRGIDRSLVKMDNWGGKWPAGTQFSNNLVFAKEELRFIAGQAVGTRFDGNSLVGRFKGFPDGVSLIPEVKMFVYQADGAGSLLPQLWRDREGAARCFAIGEYNSVPRPVKPVRGDVGLDFTGAPVRMPLLPGALQRPGG